METKGVKLLQGDPKIAIVKLSIPMIFAMLVQTMYNLVDGIWVAGLGPAALAAIGAFFPIFMIIISLASGLGVGASSVIARKIGEKNKNEADKAAVNSLAIAVIFGLTFMIVSLAIIKPVLEVLGTSKEVLDETLKYAYIIIFSIPLLMFNNVSNGILRGEGDAKKAMYAISIGSILNIFLDPLFIYTFKLGIKGAAYATVFSILVSAILIVFWLFIKKDTYVSIHIKRMKLEAKIINDILRVGIPSSIAQIAMSVAMFVLNVFAVKAGKDLGIAVFTSAWRIINFGTVPLIGIATAVTSVTGAAFGQRDAKKLKTAYLYAIRFGEIISLVVMSSILIFANYIAKAFTYSENGAQIYSELVNALRILSLFLPGVPFGMFTSSMFQGTGYGIRSMIVSINRTIIMQVLFSYLYVFVFNIGLNGVWWGIVTGNAISAAITFTWGIFTVKSIDRKFFYQNR